MSRWRVSIAGVRQAIQAWSRDLAQIASLRGVGLLLRRHVSDGAGGTVAETEWATVAADVSADDDGCLVVNPCLVVTDGTVAVQTSILGGEGIIGTRTAHPLRVATNAGALVIEDSASGGDVSLSCSGDVSIGAGGGSVQVGHTSRYLTLSSSTPAAMVISGPSSVGVMRVTTSTDVDVHATGAGEMDILGGGGVIVRAGSGSEVLVGHDGDTVGFRARQIVSVHKTDTTERETGAGVSADPHLTLPASAWFRANYRYRLKAVFNFRRTSGSGTPTLNFRWYYPSGTLIRWAENPGGAFDTLYQSNTATKSATSSERFASVEGLVITGGTSGTLEMAWGVTGGSGGDRVSIYPYGCVELTPLGPA